MELQLYVWPRQPDREKMKQFNSSQHSISRTACEANVVQRSISKQETYLEVRLGG